MDAEEAHNAVPDAGYPAVDHAPQPAGQRLDALPQPAYEVLPNLRHLLHARQQRVDHARDDPGHCPHDLRDDLRQIPDECGQQLYAGIDDKRQIRQQGVGDGADDKRHRARDSGEDIRHGGDQRRQQRDAGIDELRNSTYEELHHRRDHVRQCGNELGDGVEHTLRKSAHELQRRREHLRHVRQQRLHDLRDDERHLRHEVRQGVRNAATERGDDLHTCADDLRQKGKQTLCQGGYDGLDNRRQLRDSGEDTGRQRRDDGRSAFQYRIRQCGDQLRRLRYQVCRCPHHRLHTVLYLLCCAVDSRGKVRGSVHDLRDAGEQISNHTVLQPAYRLLQAGQAVGEGRGGGDGLAAHDHAVVVGFLFERLRIGRGHVQHCRHVRSGLAQQVVGGSGAFRARLHVLQRRDNKRQLLILTLAVQVGDGQAHRFQLRRCRGGAVPRVGNDAGQLLHAGLEIVHIRAAALEHIAPLLIRLR